jgi:ABC-type Fe3+-hydroxamate transport system substrate-binding protein
MADQPSDQDSRTYYSRIESPIDYAPQRVVSLVPSITESLFDLDLDDRLIAITDYCTRPAHGVKSVPRVGGTKNPDIQRILELQPDLVLMNDEENRREDAETLRAAGIPLWVASPRTVFDVLNLLWNMMDIFDHTVMVPRVREIERAYDYTLSAARAAASVRVFAPIWCDPWMTFNADTYAHDVLRVCGGNNVFAGYEQRYPSLSLDEIVLAQPEIVLLPDEPYPFSEADVEAIHALDIPAAHNEHIYRIDGSLLTWHGTRVAYALRDLPVLLMAGSGEHDSARHHS